MYHVEQMRSAYNQNDDGGYCMVRIKNKTKQHANMEIISQGNVLISDFSTYKER